MLLAYGFAEKKFHLKIIEIEISLFHTETYQHSCNIMHYVSGMEPLKKGQENVSAWI